MPKWLKPHEGDIEIVMIIIGPLAIGLRLDKLRPGFDKLRRIWSKR